MSTRVTPVTQNLQRCGKSEFCAQITIFLTEDKSSALFNRFESARSLLRPRSQLIKLRHHSVHDRFSETHDIGEMGGHVFATVMVAVAPSSTLTVKRTLQSAQASSLSSRVLLLLLHRQWSLQYTFYEHPTRQTCMPSSGQPIFLLFTSD